jgi:hypothetical protein
LLISENGFNLILGELEDGWDHKWLHKVLQCILVWSSSVNVEVFTHGSFWMRFTILDFLEISEENDGWFFSR